MFLTNQDFYPESYPDQKEFLDYDANNRGEEMTTVYLSGAVSGDQNKVEILQKMCKFFEERDFTVLGEHQTDKEPGQELKHLGCRQDFHVATQIERTCRLAINHADYFVAEFSGSSTGVGREIEYAYNKSENDQKPYKLLCVFQIDSTTASPMVIGMHPPYYHNVTIYGYTDWTDLEEYLLKFFKISRICDKTIA